MEERKNHRCSGPVYAPAFGRRSFIQVGLLGGVGLSLPDLFRVTARASSFDGALSIAGDYRGRILIWDGQRMATLAAPAPQAGGPSY